MAEISNYSVELNLGCSLNCKTCNKTTSSCLTCADPTHMTAAPECACPTNSYITQSLQIVQCVCSGGYFFSSNKVCSACSPNCALCTNTYGNCNACTDTTHMSPAPSCACPTNGALSGTSCTCNAGYFFSSNTVCSACDPKCATCNWSADHCIRCIDPTHMSDGLYCYCPPDSTLKAKTCVCKSGYFFSSNILCSPCNANCAMCNTSADNCVSCTDYIHMSAPPACACPTNGFLQGSTCVCSAGYFFSSDKVCSACNSNCATCSGTAGNCKTCSDTAHMTAAPACACPANSVLKAGTCVLLFLSAD